MENFFYHLKELALKEAEKENFEVAIFDDGYRTNQLIMILVLFVLII